MYKVYWTGSAGETNAKDFEAIKEALDFAQWMRTSSATYVTIVSENPNCVGKMGVDSVVDGKLPDGNDYEWKKRRK